MAEMLSKSSVERIDALCEKISGGYESNHETHRELRGHIEDLVLGYLTASRKLTEDDAVLLAERHFGDPAKLRGMFGAAHRTNLHAPFARRLGAFITAYMLAWLVMRIVQWLYTYIVADKLSASTLATWRSCIIFGMANYPAVLAVMTLLLFRWRRSLRKKKTVWFLSVSPGVLLFTVISATAACAFMPLLYCSVTAIPDFLSAYKPSLVATPYIRMGFALTTVLIAAWWCDATLGWKRSPAFLAGTAVVMALILSLVMPIGTWSGSPVMISTKVNGHLLTGVHLISPLMFGVRWWRWEIFPVISGSSGSFLMGLIGIPLYVSVARRIAHRKQVETT